MSGASSRKSRLVARFLPARMAPATDPGLIFAALPVATIVLDADNRFRNVNNAAEQFFGASATGLVDTPLGEFLPHDNRIFALLDQVRRFEARVSDHDLALESPRMHRRGVTVHAAPLPEVVGSVIVMLEDGSTAQMLDRQLNFRGAARGASAMAAMLAHEVKNPLSGIRGAAQLLEQAALEPDRELCQLIQDEVDRITGLVDRFDMFSEHPVERSAVNIHQVLDHVRRIAASGFAAHLRIIEEYDPSLPLVWGNRDQLVQILLNLVKNAAEAVDPVGGELVLATSYRHGVRIAVPGSQQRVHLPLEVSVRDNGHGIEEGLRATLFEPFVTTKRGGQGLGLALVAKLVADQGGLIECDSRPGRTIFRLSLPAPPPGAETGAAA